jgi:hypothetical protein
MDTAQQPRSPIVRNGFTGFILAGLSAAFSTTAILTWIYMARNITNLESGGMAFAANIEPLILSLVGIGLGGFSLLVTCSSLYLFWKGSRQTFTFYHFWAFLFLVPAVFLLAVLILPLFRH